MTTALAEQRRPSRRNMMLKQPRRQSSRRLVKADSLIMKSIHLVHHSPPTHRRRLSSMDSTSTDSVYSHVSDLTHGSSAFGFLGQPPNSNEDSPFGKVFDEHCQTTMSGTANNKCCALLPPTRQGSFNVLSSEHGDIVATSTRSSSSPTCNSRYSSPPRSPRNSMLHRHSPRRLIGNAPLPQRQASIPLLGRDSTQNCASRPNKSDPSSSPTSTTTSTDDTLSIAGASSHTFADYYRDNSIRDLSYHSSWSSSASFLDCSFIGDLAVEEEEEEEPTNATDISDDKDSWMASSSNSLGDGDEGREPLPLPYKQMPLLEKSNRATDMFDTSSLPRLPHPQSGSAFGKSASARDVMVENTLSNPLLSPSSGTPAPCCTTSILSSPHRQHRHNRLVKSASARHMAIRRKWIEQTSASARHLSVHKEEQEKVLLETTDNTDEEEEDENSIAEMETRPLVSSSSADTSKNVFTQILQDHQAIVENHDSHDTNEDNQSDYDERSKSTFSYCCRWTCSWLVSPVNKHS